LPALFCLIFNGNRQRDKKLSGIDFQVCLLVVKHEGEVFIVAGDSPVAVKPILLIGDGAALIRFVLIHLRIIAALDSLWKLNGQKVLVTGHFPLSKEAGFGGVIGWGG